MTTLKTSGPTAKKYRSYLLRLWRAESPDQSWRASLEDAHTGERIGFAGLEELFAFLMEQAEAMRKEEGWNLPDRSRSNGTCHTNRPLRGRPQNKEK